jgi:hypothetical protein
MPARLTAAGVSEILRLEQYARQSQAARDLLAVLNAWRHSPDHRRDTLRAAADAFRRTQVAKLSDTVWKARHERAIGTFIVLLPADRSTVAAIDLRLFL